MSKSHFKITLFFYFLIFAGFVPSIGQSNQSLNSDTLDAKLQQIIQAVGIPAISVAVIRKGEIAYCKAFGMSNITARKSVDTNTLFEAASLTKPVVAVTALKLVEEGILDLDKPLYSYLGYAYGGVTDPRIKNITARMVLSHTSGFPNWRVKKLKIDSKPSEKFSYSGEGFVYLQRVMEKITHKSLPDLVKEKIFNPLMMTNSFLVFDPKIHKNHTEGYNKKNQYVKGYRPQTANAAASMLTTAKDYSLFVMSLLKNQILKAETISQLFSPQISISEEDKKLFWGLGWGLEKTESDIAFWHWGDNSGYKCFVIALKGSKSALIYFTNSNKGLGIQNKIIKLTLGLEFGLCKWLDYTQY